MSVNEDPSTWRRQTADGIPYKLMEGYPKGSYGEEEADAEEVYLVEGSRMLDFVSESFPPSLAQQDLFVFPNKRPMPGQTTLRTQTIAWEPFDSSRPFDPFNVDSGAPAKTYGDDATHDPIAKLTIRYKTGKQNEQNPQDPDDLRNYLEISASAAGEFLMLPTRGDNAEWQAGESIGDNVPIKELNLPLTKVIPEVEWSVRWTQLPYSYVRDTLVPAMRQLLGKVNNGAMHILIDAPEETILFVGFAYSEQSSWRTDQFGHPPIAVDMKFAEKHIDDDEVKGHNHFWREETGSFEKLLVGGSTVYSKVDLNTLFPPAFRGPPVDVPPPPIEVGADA